MSREKDPKREEKIIKVATKIFAKNGFFNATIKDISREANIAEGSVYTYFESKEDLLKHIFEKGWSQVVDEVKTKIQLHQGPWEKFELLLVSTLEFFKNDLDLAKVLIRESFPGKGGLGEKAVVREWFTFRGIVEDILQEAKDRRLIPESFKISALRQLLHGAVEMAIYGWVLEKENKKYKASYAAKHITKMIMAMLKGLSTCVS